MSNESLFLGLDLSTQQLKAIFINEKLVVVSAESVRFDDLGFNTTDGYIELNGTITGKMEYMYSKAIWFTVTCFKETVFDKETRFKITLVIISIILNRVFLSKAELRSAP
mgnify:CR=1 FL=1